MFNDNPSKIEVVAVVVIAALIAVTFARLSVMPTESSSFFDAKITDWLLAVFTLALVVFTFGQISDSRSVQRAFVYNESFDYRFFGQALMIAPKWVNSGATQTRRMHVWVSWKIFDGDPGDDYTFPDLDAAGEPVAAGGIGTPCFLGPKASIFGEYIVIGTDHLERVRNTDARLFMWGRATYFDTFSGTPRRVTRFCNEIVVSHFIQRGDEIEAAVTFPLYRRGNCADDECGTV